MKGSRPFKDTQEIAVFRRSLGGKYAVRDRAVLALGLATGGRISELLALKIGDVYRNGRFSERVYFPRRTRKGKVEGHSLVLKRAACIALGRWLITLRRKGDPLDAASPLFRSRKGAAIGAKTYWAIMKSAATGGKLCPGISTHGMRKTVAHRAYERSGHDLILVGRILGHRGDIRTTAAYLGYGMDAKADTILASL